MKYTCQSCGWVGDDVEDQYDLVFSDNGHVVVAYYRDGEPYQELCGPLVNKLEEKIKLVLELI